MMETRREGVRSRMYAHDRSRTRRSPPRYNPRNPVRLPFPQHERRLQPTSHQTTSRPSGSTDHLGPAPYRTRIARLVTVSEQADGQQYVRRPLGLFGATGFGNEVHGLADGIANFILRFVTYTTAWQRAIFHTSSLRQPCARKSCQERLKDSLTCTILWLHTERVTDVQPMRGGQALETEMHVSQL